MSGMDAYVNRGLLVAISKILLSSGLDKKNSNIDAAHKDGPVQGRAARITRINVDAFTEEPRDLGRVSGLDCCDVGPLHSPHCLAALVFHPVGSRYHREVGDCQASHRRRSRTWLASRRPLRRERFVERPCAVRQHRRLTRGQHHGRNDAPLRFERHSRHLGTVLASRHVLGKLDRRVHSHAADPALEQRRERPVLAGILLRRRAASSAWGAQRLNPVPVCNLRLRRV
mmetsp:Transcript_26382/g.69332  ORF Transcript_26382/g.69332 Transcript_26382/m.69332 type:complete len:228 (-) Transcript_26382:531-1214(-)